MGKMNYTEKTGQLQGIKPKKKKKNIEQQPI
jgi:hypothetical protein